MTIADIRAQIREVKQQMKEKGVRRISCFNAGLTPQEYLYNSQLFVLNTNLQEAEKQGAKGA